MSAVVVPVNLKFLGDEEVYVNLVCQLRNSRDLTKFITNLLTAYYYDDEIRESIDTYRGGTNYFRHIESNIEALIKSASNRAASIADASDMIEDAREGTAYVSDSMEERMARIEDRISGFGKLDDMIIKVDALLKGIAGGQVGLIDISSKDAASLIGEDFPSAGYGEPVNFVGVSDEDVVAPGYTNGGSAHTTVSVVSDVLETNEGVLADPDFGLEDEVIDEPILEVGKKVVPASFAKLASSLGKKEDS